jgi:hypothetical protein
MIEIKSLFTGWHEVDIQQAKSYALFLQNNITAMDRQKKERYITSKIRGVELEELLNKI